MTTLRLHPRNWFKAESAPVARAHTYRPHGYLMALSTAQDEMDKLFDSFFKNISGTGTADEMRQGGSGTALSPNLDVSGDEKRYFISVELPGVEENDLRVEVDKDTLIIHGEKKHEVEEKQETQEQTGNGKVYFRMERSYGSFYRMLTLPEDVDKEAITASHKDGVLTITLPRKEFSPPQNRTIAIAKE